MSKDLISQYISEAARYLIKSHHESYRNVSQKLNLSYGYFRQLMSGNRALTTCDIYAIARLNRVSVSKLFPPVKDTSKSFRMYQKVTGDGSKQSFDQFLDYLKI